MEHSKILKENEVIAMDIVKDETTGKEKMDSIGGITNSQKYIVEIGDDAKVDLPTVAVYAAVNEKTAGKSALLKGTIPAASVSLKELARQSAAKLMTTITLGKVGETVKIPTWEEWLAPAIRTGRTAKPKFSPTVLAKAQELITAAGKDINDAVLVNEVCAKVQAKLEEMTSKVKLDI